jgi:septal ring factor EnvC (AmiA/AmiB activator)
VPRPKRVGETAKLLARYGKLIETVAEWEKRMPEMVEEEGRLAEIVDHLPRDGKLPPLFETFKRDLYQMKDTMRTIRKTTKSLRRDIKKTGAALFTESIDKQFVEDSIAKQRRIINAIVAQTVELEAGRVALRSYLSTFQKMARQAKRAQIA